MPSFTVFVASLVIAFAPFIGHGFTNAGPVSHPAAAAPASHSVAARPVLHPLDVVGGSPTVH